LEQEYKDEPINLYEGDSGDIVEIFDPTPIVQTKFEEPAEPLAFSGFPDFTKYKSPLERAMEADF